MKKVFVLLSFAVCISANAQYVTPGTGVTWNLDSLVTYSDGALENVGGGRYHQTVNITVSPTDRFVQNTAFELQMDGDVVLSAQNADFIIDTPEQSKITATNSSFVYSGLDFTDSSRVVLRNCIFEHGGGIRVLQCRFEMDSCTVQNMDYKTATSGAISATGGDGIWSRIYIRKSNFRNNVRSALGSPANIGTTFIVDECLFENNNTENGNRPQLNLGPTIDGDTARIVKSIINGYRANTMTGGIGISYMMSEARTNNYMIEDNIIQNNRYGITFTGHYLNGTVLDNEILNNDTEGAPMTGGSGINITAPMGNVSVSASDNIIAGHLWGVTLVGSGAVCNFGNIAVPQNHPDYNLGFNIFRNNENGGQLHDFYNNSTADIMAQNNLWNVNVQDAESIETVITHKVDNNALGTVTFMPSSYGFPIYMETSFDENCVMTLSWSHLGDVENGTYNIYRNGTLVGEAIEEQFYTAAVENEVCEWCVETVFETFVSGKACTENIICTVSGISNAFAQSVTVYPVPTTDRIYISGTGIAKVEVYSAAGQMLIETDSADASLTVDLSSINAGIYFIRIYDLNGNRTVRQIMKL
ncbi:MAG: T9SS type A sorting domain-containing protein [Cytophagaceae bacterium]|jgi:parallel beta-helix repeat protein|nr:T9SS type A sorting domain-containing protein [Cytophagaceae bacterium]